MTSELPQTISTACSKYTITAAKFAAGISVCDLNGNQYYTAEQYEQCYYTWHVEANGATIHPYGTETFTPYPECN